MGYTIGIGERKQEEVEEGIWQVTVETVALEEAPNWWDGEESVGKGNWRYPSYAQMASFAQQSGLYDLFFHPKDGLLREPGAVSLTLQHLHRVKEALHQWEKQYPHTVPGVMEGCDSVKARLQWYVFWMEWALTNMQHPIVVNL